MSTLPKEVVPVAAPSSASQKNNNTQTSTNKTQK